MNRVLRRLSSVTLITRQAYALFFVPSKLNPADEPSRPHVVTRGDPLFLRLRRARRGG